MTKAWWSSDITTNHPVLSHKPTTSHDYIPHLLLAVVHLGTTLTVTPHKHSLLDPNQNATLSGDPNNTNPHGLARLICQKHTHNKHRASKVAASIIVGGSSHLIRYPYRS